MIRIVEGSIFNCKEKIIVQQCNASGKMMSGIAKEIRKRYPIVFDEYFKLYQKCISENKPMLGLCQLVQVEENKYVANIFGQRFYGRNAKYTNYNAFIRGLTRLLLTSDCDIAIPYRIACALGGGDWQKLYSIIQILAEDFPHDIVFYRLPQ